MSVESRAKPGANVAKRTWPLSERQHRFGRHVRAALFAARELLDGTESGQERPLRCACRRPGE
jgi:hypothetical protein